MQLFTIATFVESMVVLHFQREDMIHRVLSHVIIVVMKNTMVKRLLKVQLNAGHQIIRIGFIADIKKDSNLYMSFTILTINKKSFSLTKKNSIKQIKSLLKRQLLYLYLQEF